MSYEFDYSIRDYEFDRMLDEYQEREAEMAEERAVVGDKQAMRPNAVRDDVTFGDLAEGDYMTAEEGSTARWVKIVKVEGDRKTEAEAKITFEVPQPLGVAMEDHWVIYRPWTDTVVIDRSVRVQS